MKAVHFSSEPRYVWTILSTDDAEAVARCFFKTMDVTEAERLAHQFAASDKLLAACKRAEQTIRNLGNGWLTGDGQTIALNEATNLRAAIAAAEPNGALAKGT